MTSPASGCRRRYRAPAQPTSTRTTYLLCAVGVVVGILLLVGLDDSFKIFAAGLLGVSLGKALRTGWKRHGCDPGITIVVDVPDDAPGPRLLHARGMRPETVAYRRVFAGVLAVLSDVDPYGLEPGGADGAPADEYEPEAGDLTRLLVHDGAVTRDGVDDVWQRWFSESLSLRLGVEGVGRLVARLNAVVGG